MFILGVEEVSIALIIHKVSIMISIIIGFIFIFKRNKMLRSIHYVVGIVTLFSIPIYLIEIKFSSIGYVIYGIILSIGFYKL